MVWPLDRKAFTATVMLADSALPRRAQESLTTPLHTTANKLLFLFFFFFYLFFIYFLVGLVGLVGFFPIVRPKLCSTNRHDLVTFAIHTLGQFPFR